MQIQELDGGKFWDVVKGTHWVAGGLTPPNSGRGYIHPTLYRQPLQ
ncbi:hypothetical protein JWG41_04865 [Leptospira sp. 201903075]|nr:hypothetical protein [Leptospira chreensis]MBM9589764.1 hypothetical protein [Leptospira chreensis]